jgi:hypothetical protein
MQSFLEKLSPNFYIAAFIPSLGFLLTAVVIFEPIIPPTLKERLTFGFDSLTQEPLLFLVVTLILGFTLSSLNTFIYKTLEGYIFLARLSFLNVRKRQLNKARKQKEQIAFEEQKLSENFESLPRDELRKIRDTLYSLKADYQTSFPPTEQAILPTRFGNIFRAAETYPAERYGIDSVPMWPRLIHVMPSSYYDKVEQSNNGLAFIINCMLLSLVLSFLCLGAGFYQEVAYKRSQAEFEKQYATLANPEPPERIVFENVEIVYFLPVNVSLRAQEIYQQRRTMYLTLSFVIALVFFLFYLASIPVVRQYTSLIKSAYDLFRFDLLKQLRLPLPNDSKEEYDLWRQVSEFMVVGNADNSLFFSYVVAETEGNSASTDA